MSTISKALQGILFTGADLDLASASWKGKVSAIYGFNAAGNGYTVFKPASAFNSLTKLVQDGAYIVAANTPGFDLPGAVLTATGSSGKTPTTTLAPAINTLIVRRNEQTGNVRVVANVAGADTIKVFSTSSAPGLPVTASLVANQDNVIDTDVYYDDLDAGRVDLQLLKSGNVVLNYSFWIHD